MQFILTCQIVWLFRDFGLFTILVGFCNNIFSFSDKFGILDNLFKISSTSPLITGDIYGFLFILDLLLVIPIVSGTLLIIVNKFSSLKFLNLLNRLSLFILIFSNPLVIISAIFLLFITNVG